MTQARSNPTALARILAQASRPQNVVFSGLLATVVAMVAGSIWAGLRCYLLLWLLYAVAATYNNLHDILADTVNKRRENPFVAGKLSKRAAHIWLWVNVTLAAVVQIWLRQPYSIVLTAVYLLLLFGYSSPRTQLQSAGFAAPVLLAVCYTGIPVLLASSQLGAPKYALAGLLSLLCIPLLLAKDYKDVKGDTLAGKRTPLVRYGAAVIQRVSLYLALTMSAATIAYALQLDHSPVRLLTISGALVVYVYSVWYTHWVQTRRPRHFLRLPQLALLMIAGCLSWLG